MYPPQQVFLTWGLQSLGHPWGVDCLKLFTELCMYVYTGIFLRKEVPSFHQILKESRDLNRIQNSCSRYLLCRSAFPNINV